MGLKAEVADPMTTPEDWMVDPAAAFCSCEVWKAAVLDASTCWLEDWTEVLDASSCLLLVENSEAEACIVAPLEDSTTATEDLEADSLRCSEEKTASFASA